MRPFAIAAFLAALLVGMYSAGPAAEPMTPEAIYLRAVRAMKEAQQPPYVRFREDVTARNMKLTCSKDGTTLAFKHGDAHATYEVWYRTKDERAVNLDLATQQHCNGTLLEPAGDDVAGLGASPAPDASPSPGAADAAPPLIGAVRVEAARYYRISLTGREDFEGHPVYRLTLHAYRDPVKYFLTGMLVDTDTFLIRQVQGEAAAHFVVGSGRIAGTLSFDRSGAYWIARDERFDIAVNALFFHARSSVSVLGSDFSFAEALPDVAFPSPEPSPHR